MRPSIMWNIAVVEDDENDFNCLNDFLLRYAKEKNGAVTIKRFKTADAFLFEYKKIYDVIFMDIMMPGTNGMESAKKLREIDQETILIFVTTISRMAIQGYEVGALDFILKPLEYPSFSLKLDRAFSKLKKNKGKQLYIKTKDGMIAFKEEELLYIEVINHRLIYHFADKDMETYGSLKNAQNDLNKKHFYKTNNCYLVNMSHIAGINGYDLLLDNKATLSISHPKRAEFLKTYHQYILGGEDDLE